MTNYTPHKKKLNFDIIVSPSKHASPVSSPYKHVSPVSSNDKHVSPVSVSEPNLNVTMSPQSSPTFNIHDPRIYLQPTPRLENDPYETPPFHHSPYSWSPDYSPNWSP